MQHQTWWLVAHLDLTNSSAVADVLQNFYKLLQYDAISIDTMIETPGIPD